MASIIGIKIANGDFFSIIEENSNVKRRLILTTVHDSQKSMQIDLYRSLMHTMADAQYIGSIVVENIKPKPRGEPSIELVISSNESGDLTASALDLDSSARAEHLHLSVSLKSLDINNHEYDFPDFELDQNESPPQGLYEKASRIRNREKGKKSPWIIIVIAGLVIILAALAFWFFLLRGGSTRGGPLPSPAVEQPARAPEPSPSPEPVPLAEPSSPPPEPAPEQPAKASEPVPAMDPVRVIEAAKPAESAPAAVSRTRQSSAPVSSYAAPAVIPKGGVVYRIRWGDTLWDISEAFYRNPWLYSRIARYNGIHNPDLIISGTTIRIPPKN
ncbi:MAG: LysM peptidoglycan-binding domain-containing protein [Spirochaetaceae bacterium]|jgi:LysM repeat protein|nr:LysM peptidoglycan-binding domain-containing protein [Spirochaetaceae bacterium]